MSDASRKAHWENVYTTKTEKEVSWFQENPAPSLELIAAVGLSEEAAIIDIGGGASRLVDDLLARKFHRLTVLDLSAAVLASASERLGDRGAHVQWIIADVTKWEPSQTYDLWHDRAAFHFLTDHTDQSAYVDRLKPAAKPGGTSLSVRSLRTVRNDAVACRSRATTRPVWADFWEATSSLWIQDDTTM